MHIADGDSEPVPCAHPTIETGAKRPHGVFRFKILRFQIVKYSVELFKASPRGGRDGRFPLFQIAWFALFIHDVFKILSVKFLQSPQLQEQPMDEDEFLFELLFRILSAGGHLLLDERQCPVACLVIFHEGKLFRQTLAGLLYVNGIVRQYLQR